MDRPRGPAYDLKTPKFTVGMHVAREQILSPYSRLCILQFHLKKTRSILISLKRDGYLEDWPGGKAPIPKGNKESIRDLMAVIDGAYEVEIAGVISSCMHIDMSVSNQCYVGGGSGWSGISFQYQLLFRAFHKGNHVAVLVSPEAFTWGEYDIEVALIEKKGA